MRKKKRPASVIVNVNTATLRLETLENVAAAVEAAGDILGYTQDGWFDLDKSALESINGGLASLLYHCSKTIAKCAPKQSQDKRQGG